MSPAFIGNYQAYVMERLNEFTITPPFLPSICQNSINAVIDLLPRPIITDVVTVDNADTGAVDDNAETEAIGGNADTGAVGDITETGAVDSDASSKAESDTITDNNEGESPSSQHDVRNYRLHNLVVKVTLYDRDGKLIASKKSISVRVGNENYLPPLERAKLFREWIKSHNSKVRNGGSEVLNVEQVIAYAKKKRWIFDEAGYSDDPLYSKDGIEKELEEMIDELREYLCNDNLMHFFMEPVSGLPLLRHGFVRVKRSERWFVHVSPAEELFVYDHKKFLENSKYKEYFEAQEDDVKNHITEECDGRKSIISEYLLRMLFSDEDVVSNSPPFLSPNTFLRYYSTHTK